MALNYLGYIRLNKNYGLPTVSNTDFSDLSKWSVSGGTTINSQTTTDLNVTTTATDYFATILTSPSWSPAINYTYGNYFLIKATINYSAGSGTKRIFAVRRYLSTESTTANYVDITPGITNISIRYNPNGYVFDKIDLRVGLVDAGAFTFNISNVSIVSCDLAGVEGSFSDYISGYSVVTYWDDVALGFKVYVFDNTLALNSTLETSGPNLGLLDVSQVTLSGYQVCSGTNLLTFPFTRQSPDFPYFTKQISVNDAACSVSGGNPIVCDVLFSTPTVTYSTTASSNDGSVQLSAAGSHGAVRYGYYPPSVPQGQYLNVANTSGLFSGLGKGTYTFYAVDQYNCYDSIAVYVGIQKTHTVKYRMQYYDVMTNVQTVADIEERNYSGSIIHPKYTSNPVLITKNNGTLNEKFDTIRPTFATVNLDSERHFQYLGMFSQDDSRYILSYSHSSWSWTGKLVPSTYSEAYVGSVNYPISLKFSCGLATLNKYDFLDDSGNAIYATKSLLSIIVLILNKIGLGLNIISGINKFASGMSTGVSDDPLAQTYLECLCFYDSGTPKCNDVLEAILKPFGAYIIQDNGKWTILDVDAQTSTYNYREFDSDGVYVTHGTINPTLTLGSATNPITNVSITQNNANLEIIPAYGTIKVNQSFVRRKSIFSTTLDSGWTPYISGGGYVQYYSIKDSPDKGITFLNLDGSGGGTYYSASSTITFASQPYTLSSLNDSVNISFDYKIVLTNWASFTDSFTGFTFNPGNVPDPAWIRIGWRIKLTLGSTVYYYNERLGWNSFASVGTSGSSVTIPTSHPASKSLTTQTGLSLYPGQDIKVQNDSTHYFRGQVTSYDTSTGALVVSSYANEGSSTLSSWTIYTSGPEYKTNYIFADKYNDTFETFNKDIDLPYFVGGSEISLQVELDFCGTRNLDFTDLATLHALKSAVYDDGFGICGNDPTNAYYLAWYKLRPGTDAESSPTIIRANDFNSSSNAVVWDNTNYTKYKYVKPINYISLQSLFVKFLPSKQEPPQSTTLTYVNNVDYIENLSYDITVGDITDFTDNRGIYTNILLKSDGVPTRDWVRTDIAGSLPIQAHLLRSLGSQYSRPTWSLSGSFLAPNIFLKSVIKQTISAIGLSLTNTELPVGTGWTQSGSTQAWSAGATYSYVDFSSVLTGNSKYVTQSQTINEGMRLLVTFSIQRLNSTFDARKDQFTCVLLSGGSVVQSVSLCSDLISDITVISTFLFTTDVQADSIGYYIKNVSGTGPCEYRVDYFRVVDVNVVRYYYPHMIERNDKHNQYKTTFSQLIPAVPSTDASIDDTGGSNTTGFGTFSQFTLGDFNTNFFSTDFN